MKTVWDTVHAVLSTNETEDRVVDRFDDVHKLLMKYNKEYPNMSLSLAG